MVEVLLLAIVALVLIAVLLQILIWRRQPDLSPVQTRLDLIEKLAQQSERGVRDEFSRLRQEFAGQGQTLRDSLAESSGRLQNQVSETLERLRADNERRLEQMRQTVDEKLQGTLEARLGESFKLVSERLEQVHKGLGEMQSLASDVGGLKRVLSNVKTRGMWGEVQLGSLLEQMLAPDQYAQNVSTTGTLERVEFAIRLPGAEQGKTCWLPVDAKFPLEDYQRLIDAAERGEPAAVEAASKALEITLRLCARSISEKYLQPPQTTDFGILFLATEGLYAEAIRRPGLAEALQREHRVVLTGPNTFAAILNSLQMGFRTLAIQKRSSEVWETLGMVRTEFSKYAGVLEKVRKKLHEASHTVEDAERRTRVLQKRLRGMEGASDAMPAEAGLLDFSTAFSEGEDKAPGESSNTNLRMFP